MKKVYLLLLFLLSFNIYSQEYTIHLKNKEIIKTNHIYISFSDKIVEYTPIGKKWMKNAKFNKIDYIDFNSNSILKSFKTKSSTDLMYVRYISAKYILATIAINVESSKYGTLRTEYKLYVFDSKEKFIEKSEFKTVRNEKKYINERKDTYSFLEKFFKEDTTFMTVLSEYKQKEDSDFTKIIEFVSKSNLIK